MAIIENKVTTFTCDLPGCLNQLTVGGEYAKHEAIQNGWAIEVKIFRFDKCYCPRHIKELEDWLEGNICFGSTGYSD